MPRRHSLRLRVALAFAALGATLSLVFAIGILVTAQDLSRRLMDETLEAELSDYLARRARNPNSLPPATANLSGFWIDAPSPIGPVTQDDVRSNIVSLPPGRHEIALLGMPYRVAVAESQGKRFALLFNESGQQRREQRFALHLAAGVALMALLSAFGGWWLAGLGIAPVTQLAHAVSRAAPENPPRLARSSGPGDEIDELAQAFDHYHARLAAFIERERAFAADASHELRTPLTAIRGAAEILADASDLPPAQAARVQRIARAAQEMGELVEAILLLGREGATPIDNPCAATQIVAECIERYRGMAESRQTRIEEDLAAEVRLPVPPAFFAIVVANLVHNAVNHTRGGFISVRLDARGLVVADTGSGIPSADIARVFERHFRGTHSAGAGIGLSLVKRICERVGWQIALTSHPVEGTTITLSFPHGTNPGGKSLHSEFTVA